MINILTLILFIFCITVFLFERKIYKVNTTPLGLVLFSNIPVMLLYACVGRPLGFHPIEPLTYFITVCGMSIFAVIGLLLIIRKKDIIPQPKLCDNNYENIFNHKTLIYTITFISLVYMYKKMGNIGIEEITQDDDMATQFGGTGLSGHILVLEVLLLAHFLCVYKNKYLFFIIPLIVVLFMYQVKVWIMAPFIVSLFIKNEFFKKKISIIKIVLFSFAIFAIFSITYFMALGWDTENLEFITNHFVKYFFAGISGLNEAILQELPIGQNPYHGLPSFIKIFLSYEYIVDYRYDYLIVNDINMEYTNVYGLFGSLYLYNGIFIAIIYVIILGLFSYAYFLLKQESTNYWFNLSYFFWTLGLTLSFFSNYYFLLNIYELTVYSLIFYIIFRYNISYRERSPKTF